LKAKTIEGDYVVQKELFFKKEPAQKPQKHIENIKKQLQKTGNTIFKIEKLKIELDEVYFLPISLLNKFRREVFADLYEQLGKKYVRNLIERKELTDIKYYLEEVDYRANISNHLSEKFYKKYGVKIIEKAFELSNNHSSKVLMTTKYCLRYELGQCPRFQHFDRKSDIKYLKYGDKVFELVFDCKKCQMEIRSIE
jgi:putative protease